MKEALAISLVAAAVAAVSVTVLRRAPDRPDAARPTPAISVPAPASTAPAGPVTAKTESLHPATARPAATAADPMNIAAPEFGGHIETVTSESDHEDRGAIHLIDRSLPEQSSWSAAAASPQKIVIGFFQRQSAHISAIVFNPNTHTAARWAKDVEAWASMDSPTSGFVKAGSLTLARDDVEQTMKLAPPVAARFVEIRVLSQYLGDDYQVGLGKIRVLGELNDTAREAVLAPEPAAPAVPPTVPPQTPTLAACDAAPSKAPPPAHGSSAKVLVLARKDSMYAPLLYAAEPPATRATSIFGTLAFTRVAPGAASAALLDASQGYDTVVLAQVCDVKTILPDSFTRALLAWVSQGHKLIIHDADQCDAEHRPDYSFLPYAFATSNPGRHGAESRKLTFVEENSLGRSTPGDPAFIDLDGWTKAHNELGDSNTVTQYDARWCGALMTRNMLNINGFVETYAHYGRGLILYDGFDAEQGANPFYRRLVTHELEQPFDPDGLQCGARLAAFVLTTEQALRTQHMKASHTYRYPVTLLSNQGYRGTVHLTAAPSPADPAVTAALDKDAVDLVDSSDLQLTVTTTGDAVEAARVLKADHVVVTARGESVITVVIDGDRFQLRR